METLLEKTWTGEELKKIRGHIREKYNWLQIAEQTIEVYRMTQSA